MYSKGDESDRADLMVTFCVGQSEKSCLIRLHFSRSQQEIQRNKSDGNLGKGTTRAKALVLRYAAVFKEQQSRDQCNFTPHPCIILKPPPPLGSLPLSSWSSQLSPLYIIAIVLSYFLQIVYCVSSNVLISANKFNSLQLKQERVKINCPKPYSQ